MIAPVCERADFFKIRFTEDKLAVPSHPQLEFSLRVLRKTSKERVEILDPFDIVVADVQKRNRGLVEHMQGRDKAQDQKRRRLTFTLAA